MLICPGLFKIHTNIIQCKPFVKETLFFLHVSLLIASSPGTLYNVYCSVSQMALRPPNMRGLSSGCGGTTQECDGCLLFPNRRLLSRCGPGSVTGPRMGALGPPLFSQHLQCYLFEGSFPLWSTEDEGTCALHAARIRVCLEAKLNGRFEKEISEDIGE